MKKTIKSNTNKLALAALAGLCAFGSAKGFGVDAELHANTQEGIGGSVDADVGLAKAKAGTNIGLKGVDADVGAEVIGIGANTAGHVGFDGVKTRVNGYVGPFADAGANLGATWKDGVYAGVSAHALEKPNTAQQVITDGETVYQESKPAPKGYAWVYGSNGRVVGYQPVPKQETRYVQQQPVVQSNVRYVPAQQGVRYVQAQSIPAQRYVSVVRNPDVVYREIQPRVSVSYVPAVERVPAAYGVRQEVETFDGYAHKTRNTSTTYTEHQIHVNDPVEGYERHELHTRKVSKIRRVYYTYE